MLVLEFVFFKLLEGIKIDSTLRVSIWAEKNDAYLMPSQFIDVRKEDDFFILKLKVLDPYNILGKDFIDNKFFFGHPGKIIGYGFLKKIEESFK